MKVEGKLLDLDIEDDRQLNEIILEYEYVIKIIIAKYKISFKDYDDAFQEGRLGILKAVKAFKEGKGSNLTTFISLCIDRQILSFLRNDNRKKNLIHKYSYSLDSDSSESELYKSVSDKNEIESYIINTLHYKNIYNQAVSKVNALESSVYQNYIDGFPISELSEKYQIPKKQVYIIIAKVRKKIEVLMGDC